MILNLSYTLESRGNLKKYITKLRYPGHTPHQLHQNRWGWDTDVGDVLFFKLSDDTSVQPELRALA